MGIIHLGNMENKKEKLYDYELIDNSENQSTRQYRMFRFTESEAQEKNQAYALNRVNKRFVRIKARFN